MFSFESRNKLSTLKLKKDIPGKNTSALILLYVYECSKILNSIIGVSNINELRILYLFINTLLNNQ